jgi:hypothetical protein
MNSLRSVLWLASTLSLATLAQDKVNPEARVQEDFRKRVMDYVALHKTARSEGKGLKPTQSQAEIARYQRLLAHRIRERREHTGQGAIFTPEITAEFRRLTGIALQGSAGTRVQKSLNHAEPVRLPRLKVNDGYPEGAPLQSTPPSFLANLPQLPPEVEYRVAGHDLVLRDVDANLIVDLIPNLVP